MKLAPLPEDVKTEFNKLVNRHDDVREAMDQASWNDETHCAMKKILKRLAEGKEVSQDDFSHLGECMSREAFSYTEERAEEFAEANKHREINLENRGAA